MMTAAITEQQIWAWLQEIPDPEIPVISIVDLGIVREVSQCADDCERWTITITPTYSGCPATEVIAASIVQHLTGYGVPGITLRTQLSPPWTTDWLTEAARQALQKYGIAPPSSTGLPLVHITSPVQTVTVPCPLCGSARTTLISQFGSTPCKALHRCLDCREPFDYFKPY